MIMPSRLRCLAAGCLLRMHHGEKQGKMGSRVSELLVALCWYNERMSPAPDGGRDACDEGHQLPGGADAHAQHPVRLVARRLQRPLQELLGVVESACYTGDEPSHDP